MALKGSFFPYRRRLTEQARALRREPTRAENKLWFEFLRDLPVKFTRQKPLDHYIADFYCASCRLAVELDGDSHFSVRGARYDAARSAALERKGVSVLRYTNEDVMERFEGVCSEIAAAIEKAET